MDAGHIKLPDADQKCVKGPVLGFFDCIPFKNSLQHALGRDVLTTIVFLKLIYDLVKLFLGVFDKIELSTQVYVDVSGKMGL